MEIQDRKWLNGIFSYLLQYLLPKLLHKVLYSTIATHVLLWIRNSVHIQLVLIS